MTQLLTSGGARLTFGLLIIARGLGYVPVAFGDPSSYTTSYQLQAAIMPLWIYCIIQLGVGLTLVSTTSMASRLNWHGRFVSVLSFSLAILFFVIWVQSKAYTAVGTYAVISVAMLLQAIHVPSIK